MLRLRKIFENFVLTKISRPRLVPFLPLHSSASGLSLNLLQAKHVGRCGTHQVPKRHFHPTWQSICHQNSLAQEADTSNDHKKYLLRKFEGWKSIAQENNKEKKISKTNLKK